jgi:hypothetical protein
MAVNIACNGCNGYTKRTKVGAGEEHLLPLRGRTDDRDVAALVEEVQRVRSDRWRGVAANQNKKAVSTMPRRRVEAERIPAAGHKIPDACLQGQQEQTSSRGTSANKLAWHSPVRVGANVREHDVLDLDVKDEVLAQTRRRCALQTLMQNTA